MDWLDAPLPPVSEIHRRLVEVIPQELDPRNWARREMAAKVVFVMLYGYAVEGQDRYLRPTAVTDMNDEQAARQQPVDRKRWLDSVQSPRRPKRVRARWYQENTREPIRDETIRSLVELGAVIERSDLPTTSPKPRYALALSFARIFSGELTNEEVDDAIDRWQRSHLRPTDLARVELQRRGVGQSGHPLVHLPTGETRRLAPGPSADLTASVIESFASRFLKRPGVIAISESAQKLTYEDRRLAKRIGFELDPSSTLPDVILVDMGLAELLFVFVECVVSDGEITRRRREELEALASRGGVSAQRCAYVTAFRDRSDAIFRRVASSLTWGSFAWFASEPDHLLFFRRGGEVPTPDLAELQAL